MAKKTRTSRPAVDDFSLKKMINRTRFLIRVVAIILGFSFTWLEFHDIEIIPMFTDNFSNITYKILLALYFVSWIWGTSLDLKDEEYILLVAPNKGRLTLLATATIFTIGILFAWICSVKTYQGFAIALSSFFIFNVLCWIYLKVFIKDAINKSEHHYKTVRDQLDLFKIKTIRDFIYGKWQLERFAIGFVLLVLVDLFSFSNLSQIITAKLKIPSSQFMVILSIFLYVCVFEIWVWVKRIKRNITLENIEYLKREEAD